MAKVLMIQGTMSNVGKSVVTAALCRAFTRDGYRVAPFKSQNMALNSYVTEDGFEMGRAQAVQAECCLRKPDVSMNPILLKPTTDMGSQVIVNGKVLGNMSAKEYFAYKKNLIPQILEAYGKLDKENDIIVIEGAGSPAELNLKSEDIVNMGLAKMLKAPVLLVGDINPGGIFAQLYGTVSLLEKEEQQMIRGMIINKFRGDKEILKPGLAILEDKCKVPVVGVLPYHRLDIEEEDSMSRRFVKNSAARAMIRIGVIHLPHISNYTDFMPFETMENVQMQYISKRDELENMDLIIVPGTKSTMADLAWMKESGIAAKIQRLYAEGTMVCGICGGYQILGEDIEDTSGVEGRGYIEGLKILPITTKFVCDKHTIQSHGILKNEGIFASGKEQDVDGYEIHMGETTLLKTGAELMEYSTGDKGCLLENAFGTYFHGIFENSGFVEMLLKELYARKGIEFENLGSINYSEYKEEQYELLGKWARDNLDMKQIYDILWKGL